MREHFEALTRDLLGFFQLDRDTYRIKISYIKQNGGVSTLCDEIEGVLRSLGRHYVIERTIDSMVDLLLLDHITGSIEKELRQHINISGVTRLNETMSVAEIFRNAQKQPRDNTQDPDVESET